MLACTRSASLPDYFLRAILAVEAATLLEGLGFVVARKEVTRASGAGKVVAVSRSGRIPDGATLAVGERATIGNGRLRLLRIVSDSRCPEGAHCIWEGEVTLAFDFNDGSGNRTFELSQRRKPTAAVGDRNFTLQDYGPCRGSKLPAAKECATVVLGDTLTR